jgi:hypothetical protein
MIGKKSSAGAGESNQAGRLSERGADQSRVRNVVGSTTGAKMSAQQMCNSGPPKYMQRSEWDQTLCKEERKIELEGKLFLCKPMLFALFQASGGHRQEAAARLKAKRLV